ncbi:butyrophilin subfamily 3 member A2 [Amia ocellicauda]|uniref:butyrophilin subfamily 3 member A2 n=1 Tax=Amia ocellicauda TaxID=2972642 RepID=UPI003463F443
MLRLSVAGIVTLLQVCRVTTESFAVSVPTAPLVTRLGDDLTVPCHLSPAVSAVAMEVRWARESGRDPVHVYRQHQHTQGRNFSGRTTLSRAGLEKGDVSLLIRDLRVADQGRYTCFVDSGSFYDRAEVEVKISMTGSAPLVSLDGHQSGGIALSCESEGWYPQPDVQWKTKPRTTLSAAPRSHITRTPDGLYSVRSDLLLPGRAGGAVSCVVTHGGDRTQVQSRVYISDEFFMPGMTLLISLILFFSIFVIIIITFLIFYCRLRKDNLKTKDDILKLNNVLENTTFKYLFEVCN